MQILWMIYLAFRIVTVIPIPFFQSNIFTYDVLFCGLGVFSITWITICLLSKNKIFEKLCVVFIFLSGPGILALHFIAPQTIGLLPGIITIIIGTVCLLILISNRKSISFCYGQYLRKIGIGILTGVLFCFAYNLIFFPIGRNIINLDIINRIVLRIPIFILQLCTASVFEEPLFRGPILLQKNLKNKILFCILQTILFFIAHLYYWEKSNNEMFFLVPMCGLIFGILTIKFKSILPGMVSHGFINAFYKGII